MIHMYVCMYTSVCVSFCPVNSSVTNAEVTMIIPENATNMTYSVNITLTIFEESDADTYQVTLVGNNVPNITGTYIIKIFMYIIICAYMHIIQYV